MSDLIKLCSTLVLVSVSALAPADEDSYLGVVSGLFHTNPGYAELSDPLGLKLGHWIKNTDVAVEAEYATAGYSNMKGDFSFVSLGGAYRTRGKFYGKAKSGVIWTRETSPGNFDRKDVDIAFGLGVGYRVTRQISGEVDYSLITNEVDLLSFSLNYHIGG